MHPEILDINSVDPMRLVRAVVDSEPGGYLFVGEAGVAIANEINSVVAEAYERDRELVTVVDCALISKDAAVPNVGAD